jgi:hypothetical protein
MPIDRMQMPCWTCDKPQAIDACAWLGACSGDDVEHQCSPSGLPLNCCRVRVVGTVPGEAPRVTT